MINEGGETPSESGPDGPLLQKTSEKAQTN